jgi:hypothetical protein
MATQDEIDALPDELVITLAKPITVGAQTYEQLTFREPTEGMIEDAFAAGKTELEQTRFLLGFMAGVVPAVIRALPQRKYVQAMAFWQSFQQDAQPAAQNASSSS